MLRIIRRITKSRTNTNSTENSCTVRLIADTRAAVVGEGIHPGAHVVHRLHVVRALHNHIV